VFSSPPHPALGLFPFEAALEPIDDFRVQAAVGAAGSFEKPLAQLVRHPKQKAEPFAGQAGQSIQPVMNAISSFVDLDIAQAY
jgi:hypothetical protein